MDDESKKRYARVVRGTARVRASIARDVDRDHRARGEREREAAEAAELSWGVVIES